MQASIYVADDEPVLLNALVKRLSQGQHKVRAFKSSSTSRCLGEQGSKSWKHFAQKREMQW